MTKTITLKQAYESIGETIKVEDHLQDAGIVKFVDGWYFDYSTCPLTTCVASNWKIPEDYVITRDGKQLYPAPNAEYTRNAQIALVRALDYENSIGIVEYISKLIDAKIKEKMGDKCNS